MISRMRRSIRPKRARRPSDASVDPTDARNDAGHARAVGSTELTVLDLASGKQHLPMKTVEKVFKADGTLENIRETTTRIDQEALEKARREGAPRAPAEA
jgi:hypothetical protein